MRAPGRLVLLGHPVGHSLSPVFQNAALRHAGIPLTYEARDVLPPDLPAAIALLVEDRAAGNLTIPHKEAMVALCDVVLPVAQRAGAVNAFWVDDAGKLTGDNTDVGGVTLMLTQLMDGPPRGRVALLGAGGGAASVLAALERWPGVEVALYNRSPNRAARLAERFPIVTRTVDAAEEAVRGASLVINATAAGLEDDAMPIAIESLPYDAAVADLVYRRGETPWVRAARACGHRATDGLPMLVEQGALAFERWFGVPAPRQVMWDAVLVSDAT
ncbi:MAG TPA: shikimate dehydrogenase [Gemmatimonadaceae bacterium]|nr:shikimate dehydrogenase [Gemmatimonadaceae bacterium]